MDRYYTRDWNSILYKKKTIWDSKRKYHLSWSQKDSLELVTVIDTQHWTGVARIIDHEERGKGKSCIQKKSRSWGMNFSSFKSSNSSVSCERRWALIEEWNVSFDRTLIWLLSLKVVFRESVHPQLFYLAT